MSGTIALRTTAPFPTFIQGQGLITVGVTDLPGDLLAETQLIIAASPQAVDPIAVYWINLAVFRLKNRGLSYVQMATRVAELQRYISGGFVRWSQLGVTPNNQDNTGFLNGLPSGPLIIGDTPGTLNITNQWNWKSGQHFLLDPSMLILSTANLPNAVGLISQTNLAAPITDVGCYGLNLQNPANNNAGGVVLPVGSVPSIYGGRFFELYVNTFRLIDWNCAHYSAFMGLQGADQEIAYGSGTDGYPQTGHPGIRHFGNCPDNIGTTPSVPTAPGNPANVWIHDCYLESGDGVYQISGTDAGLTPNINATSYLYENCSGMGLASPIILLGTGSRTRAGTGFVSSISNFIMRNIAAVRNNHAGILVLHGNNLGTINNGLLQNITTDGEDDTTLPGALRVLGNVHNVTFQNCFMFNPNTKGLQIEAVLNTNPAAPPNTYSDNSNLTFDGCIFDSPTLPNSVNVQIKNSTNVMLRNCTILQLDETVNAPGNVTVQIGPPAVANIPVFTATGTQILNCQIQVSSHKEAILLQDANNCIVTGNVCTPVPGAIVGPAAGAPRGIVLTAPATNTPPIPNDPGTTNCVIQNNDLSAITGTPIVCASGQGNTVTNNIGAADCPP